ncbi:hypothetical protein D3H59_00080 [Micromonospora endophytica]|nr:hypothetical protein D3H59_00080 [Micromonospora endophytica]
MGGGGGRGADGCVGGGGGRGADGRVIGEGGHGVGGRVFGQGGGGRGVGGCVIGVDGGGALSPMDARASSMPAPLRPPAFASRTGRGAGEMPTHRSGRCGPAGPAGRIVGPPDDQPEQPADRPRYT